MLAGDRSSHGNAVFEYFVARANRVAKFLLVALVEQNNRVQIAVPRVKNVTDPQMILPADLLDAPQRCGKLRSRDHAVLRVVARRKPARRAKRILTTLPQKITLARIAGHAYVPGVMSRTNVGDSARVGLGRLAQSIGFAQNGGRAIRGK